MIIQRKKLRILYNDCCQNVIRINFKIAQLKRSFNESTQSHDYAVFLKELSKESYKKIFYKREIDNLFINSDIDKLADVEAKFRENLTSINLNLSKFKETKFKINKMKSAQNKLLKNIEDCIKINSN